VHVEKDAAVPQVKLAAGAARLPREERTGLIPVVTARPPAAIPRRAR